jgi:Mce-associated membrane protein
MIESIRKMLRMNAVRTMTRPVAMRYVVPAGGRRRRRRLLIGIRSRNAIVFFVLPVMVMSVGAAAAYLKWRAYYLEQSTTARIQSVQVATDVTIEMLSYEPKTIETGLDAVRDRMTGSLRDSYTELMHELVIPGAKEKNIRSVATVSSAAPVTATPDEAVVLVFVDQSVAIGDEPPTQTPSSVRVTLARQGSTWLVSDFTPI